VGAPAVAGTLTDTIDTLTEDLRVAPRRRTSPDAHRIRPAHRSTARAGETSWSDPGLPGSRSAVCGRPSGRH